MIIGSEAALCAAARAGIYSATKAFGLALGEALWAEMAPQGVDVLNVLLGATDTPMLRERLRLSGISPQAIKLALPDEVARSAIDQLAHGPTYVAYADPEDTDILTSAQARRARVLRASRSEEHTSELQSLMRISYAVFCLKKKTTLKNNRS